MPPPGPVHPTPPQNKCEVKLQEPSLPGAPELDAGRPTRVKEGGGNPRAPVSNGAGPGTSRAANIQIQNSKTEKTSSVAHSSEIPGANQPPGPSPGAHHQEPKDATEKNPPDRCAGDAPPVPAADHKLGKRKLPDRAPAQPPLLLVWDRGELPPPPKLPRLDAGAVLRPRKTQQPAKKVAKVRTSQATGQAQSNVAKPGPTSATNVTSGVQPSPTRTGTTVVYHYTRFYSEFLVLTPLIRFTAKKAKLPTQPLFTMAASTTTSTVPNISSLPPNSTVPNISSLPPNSTVPNVSSLPSTASEPSKIAQSSIPPSLATPSSVPACKAPSPEPMCVDPPSAPLGVINAASQPNVSSSPTLQSGCSDEPMDTSPPVQASCSKDNQYSHLAPPGSQNQPSTYKCSSKFKNPRKMSAPNYQLASLRHRDNRQSSSTIESDKIMSMILANSASKMPAAPAVNQSTAPSAPTTGKKSLKSKGKFKHCQAQNQRNIQSGSQYGSMDLTSLAVALTASCSSVKHANDPKSANAHTQQPNSSTSIKSDSRGQKSTALALGHTSAHAVSSATNTSVSNKIPSSGTGVQASHRNAMPGQLQLVPTSSKRVPSAALGRAPGGSTDASMKPNVGASTSTSSGAQNTVTTVDKGIQCSIPISNTNTSGLTQPDSGENDHVRKRAKLHHSSATMGQGAAVPGTSSNRSQPGNAAGTSGQSSMSRQLNGTSHRIQQKSRHLLTPASFTYPRVSRNK